MTGSAAGRPPLLLHRDFRQLWIGQTISQAGTTITRLALPLVAMADLDATPFQVGLLTVFEYASFLLVGLPAGVWIDRTRRRPVMIAADLVRATLIGSIPAAASAGLLTLPHLYLVALGCGVLSVLFDVAYQSYLPRLIDAGSLVAGNGALEASRASAQVCGPALSGFLVQALGAPMAMLADAASFAASAFFLGRIETAEDHAAPPAAERHFAREIADGLRLLFGNPALRALAVTSAIWNLSCNVSGVMIIVLLKRDLNLPAGTIGVLFSVASVGGVLGALNARRLSGLLGAGRSAVLCVLAAAMASLAMPFVQADWRLWAGTGLFALSVCATVVFNVIAVSLQQQLCPLPLLGRFSATARFIAFATTPAGALLGGILGTLVGARATIAIGVAGGLLAVLPAWFSPLREVQGPV